MAGNSEPADLLWQCVFRADTLMWGCGGRFPLEIRYNTSWRVWFYKTRFAITRQRLLSLSFARVILRLPMTLQEMKSCNMCAAARWKVMTQGWAQQGYSHVTHRVCPRVLIAHQSQLVQEPAWAESCCWCDWWDVFFFLRSREGRKIPMTQISSVWGKLGLFLWNHSSHPDVTAHHFLLYTSAALTGRTNHRLTLKYYFQRHSSLVFLKQLQQIFKEEFLSCTFSEFKKCRGSVFIVSWMFPSYYCVISVKLRGIQLIILLVFSSLLWQFTHFVFTQKVEWIHQNPLFPLWSINYLWDKNNVDLMNMWRITHHSCFIIIFLFFSHVVTQQWQTRPSLQQCFKSRPWPQQTYS